MKSLTGVPSMLWCSRYLPDVWERRGCVMVVVARGFRGEEGEVCACAWGGKVRVRW